MRRPAPTQQTPQNLSLDKGYDNDASRQVVQERGYVPHIRRIGEEKKDATAENTHPARRCFSAFRFSRIRNLPIVRGRFSPF